MEAKKLFQSDSTKPEKLFKIYLKNIIRNL